MHLTQTVLYSTVFWWRCSVVLRFTELDVLKNMATGALRKIADSQIAGTFNEFENSELQHVIALAEASEYGWNEVYALVVADLEIYESGRDGDECYDSE